MIEINEVNHASVVNASLTKIYNQARVKGKLHPQDLYILNVLFKLISDCNSTLTHDQKKQLDCIYRQLYNNSDNICRVKNLRSFKTSFKTKFIVAEKGDAQTDPLISTIYYWQEPFPFTEDSDIVDAIINDDYLKDKPTTTKSLFEFGIDIPLTHIGRVCIAFNPGFLGDKFIIKDILGNDVTHAFDKSVIPSLDIVLFVSENIHSFGLLKLLGIQEPGDPDVQIFNNVFNNIFA